MMLHTASCSDLLQAVLAADEEVVGRALDAGADVNGIHADGRTSVACAITGDDWRTVDASFMTVARVRVLRRLVAHENATLYTLNAPQDVMKGVTPLGMAAWLNWPDAVECLLDASAGAVSVDGMDAYGATALMYAVRDGNLDVAQCLLNKGARPDFRDVNYWSSIQFALEHPKLLWICEDALRRYRWRGSAVPDKKKRSYFRHPFDSQLSAFMDTRCTASASSKHPSDHFFLTHEILTLTNALIHAVLSADLPIAFSLLFPPPRTQGAGNTGDDDLPILVNYPDKNGWSPIHHCTSAPQPSIEILDALYHAGADIGLLTTEEQYTPLHCLARQTHTNPYISASHLYTFTLHLVRDLRAPLSAKDKNEDTCLHVAAQRGDSLDIVAAFLACDHDGSLRSMTNAKGFTALEVAKPEFRHAFGDLVLVARPLSGASFRTVRPMRSSSSIGSSTARQSEALASADHRPTDVYEFSPDMKALSHKLVENLRSMRLPQYSNPTPPVRERLRSMLFESRRSADIILAHFHSKVAEARRQLQNLRDAFVKLDGRLDLVARSGGSPPASQPNLNPGGRSSSVPRRPRVSDDSQATAVSRLPRMSADYSNVGPYREVGVSSNWPSSKLSDHRAHHSAPFSEWIDRLGSRPASPSRRSHFASPHTSPVSLREPGEPHHFRESVTSVDSQRSSTDAYAGGAPRALRTEEARARRIHDVRRSWRTRHAHAPHPADGTKGGTARLKTWLWRMLAHERSLVLDVVVDIEGEDCTVSKEVKDASAGGSTFEVLSVTKTAKAVSKDAFANLLPKGASWPRSGTLTLASRDLHFIEEYMSSVHQSLSCIIERIARAERIIGCALDARERILNAAASGRPSGRPGSAKEHFLSLPPSLLMLSAHRQHSDAPSSLTRSPSNGASSHRSSSSGQSSGSSLASTLADDDDENAKILGRLLLRRIPAQLETASQELSKMATWMRIVKEVIRDASKRVDE